MKRSGSLGETTEYDKKRDVEMQKPKSWLKSISAFANGTGGILIFGIADDDTVTGIEDIKSASEFVSQKIKERIDPFPEVTMQVHRTEDGKNLLTVEVMKGQETPYYYHGDGITEAFIRIGNETVTANAAELKRLVLRGKNSSFDSLMTDHDIKDHSFSKLRERIKNGMGQVCRKRVLVLLGSLMKRENLQMQEPCLRITVRSGIHGYSVRTGMDQIKAGER